MAKLLGEDDVGGLKVSTLRLDNGLRLVHAQDMRAPVLAMQIWLGAGSRHDAPGHSGTAHFLEHMMFRGSENHPNNAYDRLLESMGSESNASTWVDWTEYHCLLPAELDIAAQVARIEVDRFNRLTLEPSICMTEREVVLTERRQTVEDDPTGQASEALYAKAFSGHPYGIPTIGTDGDIARLDEHVLRDFYERYYRPGNAVLSVVGALPLESLLEVLEPVFSQWRPAADFTEDEVALSKEAANAEVTGQSTHDLSAESTRTIQLKRGVEDPFMVCGYRAPKESAEASLGIEAAMMILGFGETSRLNQDLVDRRKLAISVESSLNSFAQAGFLELWADLHDPSDVEALSERLHEHVMALTHPEKITEWEVGMAKNSMRVELLKGAGSAEGLASSFGQDAILHNQPTWSFDMLQRLATLKAETIAEHVAVGLGKTPYKVVVQ